MQKQDELPNDPSNTLGLQHTAHSTTHPCYSAATTLSVPGRLQRLWSIMLTGMDGRARNGCGKKGRSSANGDGRSCLFVGKSATSTPPVAIKSPIPVNFSDKNSSTTRRGTWMRKNAK